MIDSGTSIARDHEEHVVDAETEPLRERISSGGIAGQHPTGTADHG